MSTILTFADRKAVKASDFARMHGAASVAVYGNEKTRLTLPYGLWQSYTYTDELTIYEVITGDGAAFYTVSERYSTDPLMTEPALLDWLEDRFVDPFGDILYFPYANRIMDFYGNLRIACIPDYYLDAFCEERGLDIDECFDWLHRASSEEFRTYGILY